ncbi:MAG: glycosyltransferase family 9 protein [Desulfosalsimonadaceae bacterium]
MPRIAAEKICLIRTSAIGDTVHALALVNALRQGYPDAHLTWVLQHLPYEMVKHQPGIDQFITFDRKGGLKNWRSLAGRLRKKNFDLLLAPQASAKVSLITFLARAKVKVGFDWQRSRELLWLACNRHIPASPMRHVQDQFFEFADYLGIKDYSAFWGFRFTEAERCWQRSFFAAAGRPAAGFVIASAHPEKDWPPAFYARAMDAADKDLALQPVIIGGPSLKERRIADQILSMCRCRPITALEKPIRNTMLQLDGCRLVVAPDTGPLHIAVALGVPTIGLYGHSNPRRCGPYRFRDLLIDRYNEDELPHAPITRRTKPGRMKRIPPEEVVEKMAAALSAYPQKSGTDGNFP